MIFITRAYIYMSFVQLTFQLALQPPRSILRNTICNIIS